MARARYIKVTKIRRRKYGGNTGYRQCNMCHGTGRVKVRG